MAFKKEPFMVRAIQWLKQQGCKDISYQISSILFEYQMPDYQYRQMLHTLIEKKGIKYFINFFRKGDWSYAKRFKGEPGTGCDKLKYQMFLELQRRTGIQVAFVIWNEFNDYFVFKPLDQLPKPTIAFKGMQKTRRPEMTMWRVKDFAEEIYIQPKLI